MAEGWPSTRAYVVGSILNWLFFLAGLALLVWAQLGGFLTPWLGWPVALVITASVLGQFIVAYRSIAAMDEYWRGLTFKCGIVAAGVAISICVLWGFANQFLGVPAYPLWIVYPLFWGLFGIVSIFIRTSRA